MSEEAVKAVQVLTFRASGQLARGDADGALETARRIVDMGHTVGFEVMARAWLEKRRPDQAVEALREGTSLAPHAWPLWQLLGNTLSDLGRLDEADAAYARGLEAPNANRASLLVNRANLLDRRGDMDGALRVLDLADAPARSERDLWVHLQTLRLHLLNKARRFEEARARGEAALAERRPDEDGWESIYGELARAIWEGFQDAELARAAALAALSLDPAESTALTVLRRVRGQATAEGGLFFLVVRGPGFLRQYQVVADSPEEALEILREIEPSAASVDESRLLERAPGAMKGVVHRERAVPVQEEGTGTA